MAEPQKRVKSSSVDSLQIFTQLGRVQFSAKRICVVTRCALSSGKVSKLVQMLPEAHVKWALRGPTRGYRLTWLTQTQAHSYTHTHTHTDTHRQTQTLHINSTHALSLSSPTALPAGPKEHRTVARPSGGGSRCASMADGIGALAGGYLRLVQ